MKCSNNHMLFSHIVMKMFNCFAKNSLKRINVHTASILKEANDRKKDQKIDIKRSPKVNVFVFTYYNTTCKIFFVCSGYIYDLLCTIKMSLN